MTLEEKIALYIERLNDIRPSNRYHYELEVNPNPKGKYHRVIMDSTGQRSVHAFVGTEGSVYKAATWKAPVKPARYDINEEASFQALLTDADWAGSYLYAGQQSHKLAASR